MEQFCEYSYLLFFKQSDGLAGIMTIRYHLRRSLIESESGGVQPSQYNSRNCIFSIHFITWVQHSFNWHSGLIAAGKNIPKNLKPSALRIVHTYPQMSQHITTQSFCCATRVYLKITDSGCSHIFVGFFIAISWPLKYAQLTGAFASLASTE